MTILSNGHQWKYTEFTDNKNYSFNKKEILNSLTSEEIDDALHTYCNPKVYLDQLYFLNHIDQLLKHLLAISKD